VTNPLEIYIYEIGTPVIRRVDAEVRLVRRDATKGKGARKTIVSS
jgi:hypothetical protein